MSTEFYTLGTKDTERWEDVLDRCHSYDIYHVQGSHRLAELQENVQALLFVFKKESAIIALPLLLRPIEGLPGIEASEYKDATSVYGYPGPISNIENPSEELTDLFLNSLKNYFYNEKVIAAFSRLNPLVPSQESYLAGPSSQVSYVGPTVAIDLSLPLDQQRSQYRSNHKRDINRAKREGVQCVHDQDWDYFDGFLDDYYQTMARASATNYYFFDRSYFTCLRELLGDRLQLFVALKDGVVTAGGLFTICNSIIQYHLGGTNTHYLELAPSKLIFDTVREWGTELGAKFFHLGGGVGSSEDNLFRFKAGFSKQHFQFKVWKLVVDPGMYEHLLEQRQHWNQSNGLTSEETNYFPAYRLPVA